MELRGADRHRMQGFAAYSDTCSAAESSSTAPGTRSFAIAAE